MQEDLMKEQLALEQEMQDLGYKRYFSQLDKLKASEQTSQAASSKYVMQNYVEGIAEALDVQRKKQSGTRAKYLGLIKNLDSTVCSFIALKCVMDSVLSKEVYIVKLARQIGTKIEDQIRFTHFNEHDPDFYRSILADFKRKNTVQYSHKHRVLIHEFNEFYSWNHWLPDEQLNVGVKLLDVIMKSTGLIKRVTIGRGKSMRSLIEAEEELTHFINKVNEGKAMLSPDLLPNLVPPDDWVDIYNGGYLTPELRRMNPFIQGYNKPHKKALYEHNKVGGYDRTLDAANILQRTAWSINLEILDVMQKVWENDLRVGMPPSKPLEIPPCPLKGDLKKEDMSEEELLEFQQWKYSASTMYTEERQRVGKSASIVRTLNVAQRMSKYKEFYYVYKADSRGRLYPTAPTFNPQGADPAKGVLRFSESKCIGARGSYWLAVHGANTYGVDKVSFDERVEWVKENENEILQTAGNPLSETFWRDADKPWQFLAFCFEWRDYCIQGDSFRTKIPIAMDGSCNGIQHFSAMLRDTEGAGAVNIVPSAKPEDIYQKVANKVIQVLEESDEDIAKEWLELGITRKLCKKSVMTLPYGSTQSACRNSVGEYVKDMQFSFTDNKKAMKLLVPILWRSISNTVTAARGAMDWLKASVKYTNAIGKPYYWTTPLGFKVYGGYTDYISKRVKTELCGQLILTLANPTHEIHTTKQSKGIAPNFVHSMDACHLMSTVLKAKNITSWAMVHDSYGTHACDVDELHTCIRESFYEMYNNNSVLEDYKTTLEQEYEIELPELPETGDLDIKDVLDAEYFFA